jgi:hypothetical protein
MLSILLPKNLWKRAGKPISSGVRQSNFKGSSKYNFHELLIYIRLGVVMETRPRYRPKLQVPRNRFSNSIQPPHYSHTDIVNTQVLNLKTFNSIKQTNTQTIKMPDTTHETLLMEKCLKESIIGTTSPDNPHYTLITNALSQSTAKPPSATSTTSTMSGALSWRSRATTRPSCSCIKAPMARSSLRLRLLAL